MAKKKKIKREVNADNKFEKDTVVFMTAYDIHKIKHHLVILKIMMTIILRTYLKNTDMILVLKNLEN